MKEIGNKIRLAFKDYSFHYILCAIFFVFENVNELHGGVGPVEFVVSLVVVTALVVLFKIILTRIFKRSIPVAILVSLSMLLVLFYAHIFFFLISFPFIKSFLKEGYFMIMVLASVLVLAFLLLRGKKEFVTFNFYLNILFSAYLFLELTKFIGNASSFTNTDQLTVSSPVVTPGTFKEKPDIFFIISDAYANNKNLQRFWQYNNDSFVSFLKARGFYYVPDSRSNYDNTVSSIASTLSMDYLPEKLKVNTSKNPIQTQNQLLDKIRESPVFAKLSGEGYAIHNLSLFKILNHDQNYFDRFFNRSFYNHLLSKTLPMRLFVRYTYMDHLGLIKELYRISELKEDKPKAVYCHLLLPHFPYVYDSAGNFKRPFNPSFKNSALYLEQLIYTNKLLKQMVVKIQSDNPQAIIVVASDHGYRQLENENDRSKESFENLISIYFPDQNYDSLYPNMTSVNIFKLIFDKLENTPPDQRDDKINYFK